MSVVHRLFPSAFESIRKPQSDRRTGPVSDDRPLAEYDLAWLDDAGHPVWERRMLPDTAEVAAAVSSMARGSMLRGPDGPIAIEDLNPGDHVLADDGSYVRIDWVGARSYQPAADRPTFYRICAHAFGGQGPATDTVLGMHAQVMVDSRDCMDLVGERRAFAPIAAFEDGINVSAIAPPGEVTVYGIACALQKAVLVNGLPVETYHPSRTTLHNLNRLVLSDMARIFPQVARGNGFGAPCAAYLTLTEAQGLSMTGS